MIRDVRRPAVAAMAAFALFTAEPLIARAQTPPAPSAEAKRSASVHFRRGVELYQEGAYRAALIELNRAYEIAPDFRVLFNVGQTHYALGEYVEAIRAFEGYLAQGGSDIAATRRDEVSTTLVELNKRVATLRVTTDRDGATVKIDEHLVGTTPLAGPLSVSVGRHQVSAEADDGATASETIDVAGGDARTVSLVLVAPLVATSTVQTTPVIATQEPGWWGKQSTRHKWGYGLLASGVAVAVGGAVMAGLAAGADSDYDKALKARPGNANDIDSAHDDLQRNALIADVLFGTAIAAGVTGLVLVLVKDKPKEQQKLEVGLGYQSIVAKGRF